MPINAASNPVLESPEIWCMTKWSPTSFFNRRAYGSENLSPVPQKDLCNSIARNGPTTCQALLGRALERCPEYWVGSPRDGGLLYHTDVKYSPSSLLVEERLF
jgi:hypothetical protein